jgi:hypothetical protein
MKLIISFLLFSCLYAKTQSIVVSDKVPLVILSNLINYSARTAPLSEFYKKPLLLSFWSTTCEVSTEYLLHLDSLKKVIRDSVEFLIVTTEAEEKLNMVLNNGRLANIDFVFSVQDTLLKKVFPFRTVPHVCWINTEGKVEAITGHKEVTKENLVDFIDSHLKVQTVKADEMTNDVFFSLSPLIVNEYKKNKNRLLAYSYLGNYSPEILSMKMVALYDSADKTTRIKIINSTVGSLYKCVFNQYRGFHFSRILNEDGSVFNDTDSEYYCYDLLIKDTSSFKAYRYMQQDLDRYFGFKSSFIKRKIKVWVLKSLELENIHFNKKEKSELYESSGALIARSVSMANILDYLNGGKYFDCPIMDETKYSGKINLEMPINTRDHHVINKELAKFGLKIKVEDRWMDVIVLKKTY